MKVQLTFITATLLTLVACNGQQEVTPKKTHIPNAVALKPAAPELNLNDSLPNKRFVKSTIVNPKFNTKLLFGIWVKSNDDPACDFEWNESVFSFCDYDGDPDRLYKMDGDSIFLDNPNLIFKGRIVNATGDTLTIHWQENEKPERFVRWKN